MIRKRLPALICLVLAAAAPAAAQFPPASPEATDFVFMRRIAAADAALTAELSTLMPRAMAGVGMPPPGAAQVRARIADRTRADVSGEIDIAAAEAAAAVVLRTGFEAGFRSADMNGDGSVARAEYDSPQAFGQNRAVGSVLNAADRNGDDILDPEEIGMGIDYLMSEAADMGTLGPSHLRLFDFDGDGRVSPAEIDRAARALAAAPPRPEPVQRSLASGREPERGRTCPAPDPSARSHVILLGVYEGQAQATVAAAGQGEETTVAFLRIEPGEQPLYIVATSFTPMIWVIEGATERVETFVAQAAQSARRGPGTGVVGLAPEQVAFAPSDFCAPFFHDLRERPGRVAPEALAATLGRAPDLTIGIYELATLALPGGGIDTRPRGVFDLTVAPGLAYAPDPGSTEPPQVATSGGDAITLILRRMLRFQPGGIVAVDASSVLAAAPVEPYKILPNEAGLLQLARAGLLEAKGYDALLLTAEIPRFPAGLAGARGINLLLANGVPRPWGAPAGLSVKEAGSGRCLIARCY